MMEDDELDFYSEMPEEIGTDAPRSSTVRESELCLAKVRRYSHTTGCYRLMDNSGAVWIVSSGHTVAFRKVNPDGTTCPGVMMNYDTFRKLFVW